MCVCVCVCVCVCLYTGEMCKVNPYVIKFLIN